MEKRETKQKKVKAWVVCPKKGEWDDLMKEDTFNLIFRTKKAANQYKARCSADVKIIPITLKTP